MALCRYDGRTLSLHMVNVNDDSFLVGDSRQTRDTRRFCALFGPRNVTVSVGGETGTGKSVVAAELHRLWPRSRRSSASRRRN